MQVTIKGFLMASKTRDYDIKKHVFFERLNFSFSNYDSSKYNSNEVVVREQSFEVEVPDNFDPTAGIVANLEREKLKAAAEYQKRLTELNAEIQSYLAIENSPIEAAS